MATEVLSPLRSGALPLSPARSQKFRGSSPKTFLASSPSRVQGTPSVFSPVAETPSSTAHGAFEAVACALERDLENEKRERLEQVGFLNKSFTQEKDLLVRRTEALERQIAEERRSWFDERALLTQKLQASEVSSNGQALQQAKEAEAAVLRASREEGLRFATALEKAEKCAEVRLETERSRLEAQNVKFSEGYDSLLLKTARLEVEVETERNAAEKAAESQRATMVRVAALEAEREQLMLTHSERLYSETAALRRAQDEAARHSQKTAEEAISLRLEIQQMEAAHSRSERDSDMRQHQAVAAEALAVAERTATLVRQECEDGGKESILRAIWQLQSADDCMQTMRQQHLLEASECTSQRKEAEELKRRLADEQEQRQRLAASLAAAHTEQRELMSRLRAVEQDLDTERMETAACREANREVTTHATRDRLDTLAMVEQMRVRSRHLDTSFNEPPSGNRDAISPSSSHLGRYMREGMAISSPEVTLRPVMHHPSVASQFERLAHEVGAPLPDGGVFPARNMSTASSQLDAAFDIGGSKLLHEGSLRLARESYADVPAMSTERRHSLAWPVKQLEAPLAAAAELEKRLWNQIESPPQWHSLAAPLQLSNSAFLQSRTQLPTASKHSATSNMHDAGAPWLSGRYRSNV